MGDFRHDEHIELSDSLLSLNEMGRENMSKLRVTFLATLRNGGRRLPETLERIELLGSHFKEWTAAIYENDSKDNTPLILVDWARAHPNVIVSCNVLHTKCWKSMRSPDRGTDMAWYRNQCKSLAAGMLQASDTVICLDPDLGPDFLVNGVCTTYGHWGHWDAVFANGIRWDGVWVQADAWPFRKHNWGPLSFREVKGIVPAPTDLWISVVSAFGGIACYTKEAYQSSRYGGGDCEHVPFHRGMVKQGYDRLFVNPAQIYIHPPKRVKKIEERRKRRWYKGT